MPTPKGWQHTQCPLKTSFQLAICRPGGSSGAAAPDPIPNSAVKRPSAHDTSSQDAGKSVAARSANRKASPSSQKNQPITKTPLAPKSRGAFCVHQQRFAVKKAPCVQKGAPPSPTSHRPRPSHAPAPRGKRTANRQTPHSTAQGHAAGEDRPAGSRVAPSPQAMSICPCSRPTAADKSTPSSRV